MQRPIVHEFRSAVGLCSACHRRVQGWHPLLALAVLLNKQCGLSFAKIAQLLHSRFGLAVTRGGLVQTVHRTARRAQPTYQTLCATVRGNRTARGAQTQQVLAALLRTAQQRHLDTTALVATLVEHPDQSSPRRCSPPPAVH